MKAVVLAAGQGTRLQPLTNQLTQAFSRRWPADLSRYCIRIPKYRGGWCCGGDRLFQ